ncbi:unnamed protein product [Diamesa hyperborea]
MKILIVTISILIAVVSCAPLKDKNSEDIMEQWIAYKEKHNKKYDDTAEDAMRMDLFLKSIAQVEEHNAKYDKGESTYKQGLNHMSDWTEAERSRLTGGLRMPEANK